MASQAELQLIIQAIDKASAQILKVGGGLDTLGTKTNALAAKTTKSTAAADAFNRTSTRTLAALGAINPQAEYVRNWASRCRALSSRQIEINATRGTACFR